MITIDKRFNDEEMAILRQLIGKKIVSFRHDEFNFNNSSSQVVGIESEYGMIYLYSFTEPLDYYGSVEDVAVWKLTDEQYKFVDKKNLIKSPLTLPTAKAGGFLVRRTPRSDRSRFDLHVLPKRYFPLVQR